MSLGLALRCFFRALGDKTFGEQVAPLLAPPSDEPEKPSGEAVRLLALLQRDGRLLDFLSEDIKEYSDDEVGAAVRDIHRDCWKVLEKYVELGAVIDGEEDEEVEVTEGFDPGAIRLTGNVKGSAPFKGTLAHRGWRAKAVNLPELPEGADPLLLAPAEVEMA